MDLDFSFTLVSSLTPRRQATRTPLTDSNTLSSNLLKTSQNQSAPSKTGYSKLNNKRNKDDKENHLLKEELMNKNECVEPDTVNDAISSSKFVQKNAKDSPNFLIDMANIAVRKTRGRGRRKANDSPVQSTESRLSSPKEEIQMRNPSVINNENIVCNILENVNKLSSVSSLLVHGEIKSESDSFRGSSEIQKGVKRKSPQFNELGEILNSDNSFSDFVEGSYSDIKSNSVKNSNPYKDVSVNKGLLRVSGVSETSLSTAYDSDSIPRTHRRNVKVIPETPETDESVSNLVGKRKSWESNFTTDNCNERNSFSSSYYKKENEIGNTFVPHNNVIAKKLSPYNEKMTNCFRNIELKGKQKKKPRSSNESLLGDTFRLESSIKNQLFSTGIKNELNDTKEKTDICRAKKDKRKLSISPVLKEINTKEIDSKKSVLIGKKKHKNKANGNGKLTCELEEENMGLSGALEQVVKDNKKINKQKTKHKTNRNSPVNKISPKLTLVPPVEVIPKFEHISNWLKDANEKSIISVSSVSSLESPKDDIIPVMQKSKVRVSLSPRIKRKQKVARVTLEEEQRLFEQIHGADLAKRLSDDIEGDLIIASTPESVELSEKVLEKLYGTVWQNHTDFPQSEPRKGRKKKSLKKKSPQTERKRQRTSIYDVFSSSSSEDRFEEFLENVHRGKLESTLQRSGQPGTPDFINDSDSDCNTSIAFYQNIVSSTVKEEVNELRYYEGSENLNRRRRLSFTSSKDDCSEGGRSDKARSKGNRNKKVSTKDKKKSNPKPRPKKKVEKDNDTEAVKNSDLNIFTFVTPIRVKKGKKKDDKLDARAKNVNDTKVPRSVGKSKTPQNPIKQYDNTSTEDRLRSKYLDKGDFKVPKNLASLKTPTSIKSDVPSSPALSFLSSLSEMTAGLPCHPDALIYKKDFKKKREELTKKLFCLYNREVFENKLPDDMLIQWSTRMTSTSGYCYNKRIYSNNQISRTSRIVLSTKILDRADRLRDTLIHELCHAATWIVDSTSDGHGPYWRTWADKANRRFPELPMIKRCHDYAISTKFTYKCMSCGYCIGRHSKSLDIERKRCGYCYGKFQVFVTAKMDTASATSGSDSIKTQRNPTGFALFVKENYAAVKKENNAPHAQIMKLLSQKFAEVKISKQIANNA